MIDRRSLMRRSGSVMCATAFSMSVCFWPAIGHDAIPGLARQRAARTPDMHFAPTRHIVADAMLKLARVRADDVVYDLGSGDGRIVILAAQKYGARGVGVELDPRLLEISRQVAREGEVAHRVTFIEGDLFTTDISEATVVTLYLSTGLNRQLEPKLRRELRRGRGSSRISSASATGLPTKRFGPRTARTCFYGRFRPVEAIRVTRSVPSGCVQGLWRLWGRRVPRVNPPFRADHVGGLLGPKGLLEARQRLGRTAYPTRAAPGRRPDIRGCGSEAGSSRPEKHYGRRVAAHLLPRRFPPTTSRSHGERRH